MNLVRTAAAVTWAATLTEAKAQMRVDSSDEDTLIQALIVAAQEHVEQYLDRALTEQTFRLSLDSFPAVIRCPRAPLASVTSVKYTDTDGVEQTLAASAYVADTDVEPGSISPAYGTDWPEPRDVSSAVRIVYKAGYAAGAVPTTIKQALLMLVAYWFENREPVNVGNIVNEMPFTVEALLTPYRVWSSYPEQE